MVKSESLKSIPGIGPRISLLLNDVGIHRVDDLKGRNPEHLYQRLITTKGKHVDRCVLYTFRCAVYYASNRNHTPSKLKWWNWKD
jgi:nucleotidyltransferase/DNA polymerase involved in DNA repair